jgi:hypothetical protein
MQTAVPTLFVFSTFPQAEVVEVSERGLHFHALRQPLVVNRGSGYPSFHHFGRLQKTFAQTA